MIIFKKIRELFLKAPLLCGCSVVLLGNAIAAAIAWWLRSFLGMDMPSLSSIALDGVLNIVIQLCSVAFGFWLALWHENSR